MTPTNCSTLSLLELSSDIPDDYMPSEALSQSRRRDEEQYSAAKLVLLAALREAVPGHLSPLIERLMLLEREHHQAVADVLDLEIRLQALGFFDAAVGGDDGQPN